MPKFKTHEYIYLDEKFTDGSPKLLPLSITVLAYVSTIKNLFYRIVLIKVPCTGCQHLYF